MSDKRITVVSPFPTRVRLTMPKEDFAVFTDFLQSAETVLNGDVPSVVSKIIREMADAPVFAEDERS